LASSLFYWAHLCKNNPYRNEPPLSQDITMPLLRNVILFLIANLLGFLGAPIAYHLSISLDIFKPSDELINSGALNALFFRDTMMVWTGCAVLSLGIFFIKDKNKMLLLLLPALLPLFYGFSVLVRLS
jgi:hypothetical protein